MTPYRIASPPAPPPRRSWLERIRPRFDPWPKVTLTDANPHVRLVVTLSLLSVAADLHVRHCEIVDRAAREGHERLYAALGTVTA